MHALHAPAVAIVERLILFASALVLAPDAQERGVVGDSHNGLVQPPLRQAKLRQITGAAVLDARSEDAAVMSKEPG